MQIARTTEVAGVIRAVDSYRVRIWGPLPRAGWSRTLDEWEISDIEKIKDVLRWAETHRIPGGLVEVLAVTFLTRPGGGEQTVFTRVFGEDGDPDGGAETTIAFRAD